MDSPGRRRGAKRRVVYPSDQEDSPAKRARRTSIEENSPEEGSPSKKVPIKSFYGGTRGRYLNPLERKSLQELRAKHLSPPEVNNAQVYENLKSPSPVNRKRSTVVSASKTKAGNKKPAPRRKSLPAKSKTPLQEIVPGSARSPVKNKPIKEETRVYSPSRSGRKFFKSRRLSASSGHPSAIVQRNSLQLKYKPQSVANKPKEESRKLKSAARSGITKITPKGRASLSVGSPIPIVRSSPQRKRTPGNQSPAQYTRTSPRKQTTLNIQSPTTYARSSPRKQMTQTIQSPSTYARSSPRKQMTQIIQSPTTYTRSSPRKQKTQSSQSSGRSSLSSVRTTIPSSKNPNSQDLFSPSDWDFDDDEEMTPSIVSTDNCSDRLRETKAPVCESQDSGQASKESTESNISVAGDSVAVLSELTEDRSLSPGSSRDQSEAGAEENSPIEKPKIYSIFKSRSSLTSDQGSTSSAQSTPRSGKGVQGLTNSAKAKTSQRLRSLIDKHGKEQLTLDFGQKLKGAVQCPTCCMTYNHSEPSDEATHERFHNRLLATLKFPGWKKENVLHEYMDGSRIIVVMSDEKKGLKKVAAVKKIVDEDLGFVVDSQGVKPNSKTFMYISEDKRIVGFCIAESITSAYRVVLEKDDETSSQSTSSGSATRPWCCSTSPEKARCGINRIWVLGSERRHGTASKLLDCVRLNFLLGYPLKKSDLAFTDPTPDGRAFATKYTGTPCFLVYKHSS